MLDLGYQISGGPAPAAGPGVNVAQAILWPNAQS